MEAGTPRTGRSRANSPGTLSFRVLLTVGILVLGSALFALTQGPGAGGAALGPDLRSSGPRSPFSGGNAPLGCFAPGCGASPNLTQATGWTNVTGNASGPSPRCCSMMTYDAHDGYLLLFGGGGSSCGGACNDTWAWRDGHWFQIGTSRAPPAREWGTMTYDPFDGYVLLFGGLSLASGDALSDLWAYSNGTWTRLSAAAPPPARWAAGMVADLSDGYVLLFGGYSPSQGFLSDSWSYVGGVWQQLDAPSSPSPRWTPSMTYDPQLGGVLLFGGFNGVQGFLGDTWTFQRGLWHLLVLSPSPAPREKATMGYDAADQAVVLYGGDACLVGCGPGRPLHLFNDTWLFAQGAWTNGTEARGPPAACCDVLAYDWSAGETLLLSSNATTDGRAPTWRFQLTAPPTAGPRVLGLLVVPPAPVRSSFTTFLVEARPANGTLSFAWTGLPPSCLGGDFPVLSCPGTPPGNYTVQVVVGDGTGNHTYGTVTFQELPSVAVPSKGPVVTAPSGALLEVVLATAAVLGLMGAVIHRLLANGRDPPSARGGLRPSAKGGREGRPSPSGPKADAPPNPAGRV